MTPKALVIAVTTDANSVGVSVVPEPVSDIGVAMGLVLAPGVVVAMDVVVAMGSWASGTVGLRESEPRSLVYREGQFALFA